jgi:hypothetical protein
VELHDFYKELITLRKAQPVLQKGLIRFVEHPDLVIFERFTESDRLLVLINNTDTELTYSILYQSYLIILSVSNEEKLATSSLISIPAKSAVILSAIP